MNIEQLYNIANQNNLPIYNYYFDNIKGLYLNYNDFKAIALNKKNIKNNIDEKCVLAEELGHHFFNATYSLNADIQTIQKMEYKAKYWQILALVPIKKIKQLLMNGYDEFEICEKLEITHELFSQSIYYYTLKGEF